MLEYQNNRRIFNEFAIEALRLRSFPHAVSRLRGMYFFGSRQDAMSRMGDRDWPPYFRPENLVEFEFNSTGDLTVVDSNWITSAPLNSDGRIRTTDLSWIERYWKGDAYGAEPVWEHIGRGVAVVLDEAVRRRCFAQVKALFPESEIPILMARLAGEAGSRGGLVHPFLLRENDSTIRLRYVWRDADFHAPHVIEEIAKHPDSGYLGRLMYENSQWTRPDFGPWEHAFQVGVQKDPMGIIGNMSSVHHA